VQVSEVHVSQRKLTRHPPPSLSPSPLVPTRYNVGKVGSSNQAIEEHTWQMPGDAELIFAAGHMHIGGVNITLLAGKTKDTLRPVCTSVPKYGAKTGVIGDEKGYVTKISTCTFGGGKLNFQKGDYVRVHSVYNVDPDDARSDPIPGGNHGGVMSLFYLATAGPAGSGTHGGGGNGKGPHTGDGLHDHAAAAAWTAFACVTVLLLGTWMGMAFMWYRRRRAQAANEYMAMN